MHLKQYFFSIITATCNAHSDLPDLLESLAMQTCRDFAWIVQDGASTDGTLALLENGRENLPCLLLESEPDRGIYDAWNKALDRMRAINCRWVLFLGADDALAGPEALEQARRYLETMPEHVCYAPAGARLAGHASTENIPGCAENACLRLRHEMPFCHTALFHRSALFLSARFDARYRILGDYDFLCRTLARDSQVRAVPVTVTRMRRGGISTTLCMQPQIFKEACLIAHRNFGRLHKRHARVGASIGVVAVLCALLDARKAERVADFLRTMRGKPPAWNNPPTARRSLSASDCAVILVHYNNASDALDCLRALEALLEPPAYVLIVDNNSRSEELLALRKGWQALLASCGSPFEARQCGEEKPPPRALLVLPENTGFAGGNNAALRLLLRHTDCGAFWLLNTDTEPKPAALEALRARLNEKITAGACGSTLVSMEDQKTVQTAGGHSFCFWTGRTASLLKDADIRMVQALTAPEVEATEARMRCVSGASCLVRREAVEAAGFLPEDYFLYYEDVAFSLNLSRENFALAWAKDSVVAHKEGGSTGATSSSDKRGVVRPAYVDYLSIRNRVAVIRRYCPWTLPVALACLAAVCISRALRGQKDRLGLIVMAAWDGLCGHMGRPLRKIRAR
jgi:GT2 family glycosyltransferase